MSREYVRAATLISTFDALADPMNCMTSVHVHCIELSLLQAVRGSASLLEYKDFLDAQRSELQKVGASVHF